MDILALEILEWDGKSVSVIKNIHERFSAAPEDRLFSQLTAYLSNPKLQKGSTWLIKHHMELGHRPGTSEASEILECLPALESWESRVHILQCLPMMSLESAPIESTEAFLRQGMQDSNKFVRAWSYYGFYLFARCHEEYRQEVTMLLEEAMLCEPASVRARVKKALKQGF